MNSAVKLCGEIENGQTTLRVTDKRGDERRIAGQNRGARPWHHRVNFLDASRQSLPCYRKYDYALHPPLGDALRAGFDLPAYLSA